jgi:hypothetical protein
MDVALGDLAGRWAAHNKRLMEGRKCFGIEFIYEVPTIS